MEASTNSLQINELRAYGAGQPSNASAAGY